MVASQTGESRRGHEAVVLGAFVTLCVLCVKTYYKKGNKGQKGD